MKRALLALLRLLLQLLIFALTGTWPRIRGLEPTPERPAPKHKRAMPPRKPRPTVRRDVRGQRTPVYDVAWEGAPDTASLEVVLAGPEGGVPRPRKRARGRPVTAPSEVRPTVGGVLRSRTGLRDAIVLDAALGTRRTRR